MTTIHFIRHGDKVSGKPNPPLTQKGIEKAKLTGKYLQNQKTSKIFTSPMERTRQTAEIIARHLSLRVITDERLLERMELDIENGESMNEFMDEWRKTLRDRTYQPTHGNSAFETGKRIQSLLDEIIRSNTPDATIVIVTHGGAIADIVQNLSEENELPFVYDDDVKYLDIAECSITTIVAKKGKYRVVSLASVEHLQK